MPRDAGGQPAPPLLAWAAAAALAGAAVFALRAGPYWPAREMSALTADLTSEALAQVPPGDIRVIGLGTSLLRTATPLNERVDDAGRPVSWARITKSNWGPGYLGGSLAVIERARPDVLVIEKNLLMADQEGTEASRMRPDLMHVLRQLTPGAAHGADPLLALRARRTQHLPCPAAPVSNDELAQRQRELARAYSQPPDPAFVAPLLRLAEGGAHVMILDIPRSPAIEAATAADKQRWFARVRQLLPPGPNLSYHSGPSYAEPSLYCDASHLTIAGAKKFQQWWWQELRQARKAAP